MLPYRFCARMQVYESDIIYGTYEYSFEDNYVLIIFLIYFQFQIENSDMDGPIMLRGLLPHRVRPWFPNLDSSVHL